MDSILALLYTVVIIAFTLAGVYLSLIAAGRLFLFIRFRDQAQRAEALRRDHRGSYIHAARDHFTAISYFILLLLLALFLFINGINWLLS